MNSDRLIIPESFIIIVDDVVWFLPHNKRIFVECTGQELAQRERPYCIDDYRSLVEIGRALDMKILCGLNIGEWDRDRTIASVPNASALGENWTNAEVLEHPEIMDEIRDYINENTEYIEMAIHGLNHMYWTDDGKRIPAEYYHDEDGVFTMLPPDSMRKHLDAWFHIYESNGFTAKVDKFIPCCFRYKYSDSDREISHFLKDYGIKYVSTPFSSMKYDTEEKPVMACVENGILTTDRTKDLVHWSVIDAPVPESLKSSSFGAHWPAFISLDPKNNMKTVERWIEYLKQYKNKFDVICARDQEMAAKQTFYKRFTEIEESENGTLTLDFSNADAQNAPEGIVGNEIFINVKKPFTLTALEGTCAVELWREANDFNTYKLTRMGRIATVTIG